MLPALALVALTWIGCQSTPEPEIEAWMPSVREARQAVRQGDYQTAADAFSRSLTQAEASGSSQGRLAALDGLAATLAVRGQLGQADSLYGVLFSEQRQLVDIDSVSAQMLGSTLAQRGEVRLNRGDLAGADSCFVEILRLDSLGVIDLHPQESLLAFILSSRGHILDAAGQTAQANALRERAAALKLYAQGFSYYVGDDLQQAEQVLRGALQQQNRVLGEDHQDTARTTWLLAHLYEMAGQPAAALRHYELTDGIYTRSGASPARHADVLNDWADLLESQNQATDVLRQRAQRLRQTNQ